MAETSSPGITEQPTTGEPGPGEDQILAQGSGAEEPPQVFGPDLAEFLDQGWLPQAWQPMWDLIAAYPLLGALLLILLAYLLALGTRLVFNFVLHIWADRPGNILGGAVLAHIGRPVFVTTFALGLILAIQISALGFGRGVLVNLLSSVVVISWMLAGFRLSTALLSAATQSSKFAMVEARTTPLFDLAAKLTLLLVSSYALLLIWGINPVGWLASAGIVGIAIGFAAKDTLANLFSGLFILADAPYKIGDYINLDSGERGQVTAIGMRSTRLLTRADVEITVPNAVIANAKITNESGGPYQKMRIEIPVGVAYGSDVDRVGDLLLQLGAGHADTCAEPGPRVRIRGFGASGIDFELLAWIDDPAERGRIAHELFADVYKTFASEGIEIPYTKQDIHIKELPAGSGN